MEEKEYGTTVLLHDTTDHHPIWVNKNWENFFVKKKNSRYKDDDFMPLDGPKLQKKRKCNDDIISSFVNSDQCSQLA